MAKVTLVPCSVNLICKPDKVGHGLLVNNARIIRLRLSNVTYIAGLTEKRSTTDHQYRGSTVQANHILAKNL